MPKLVECLNDSNAKVQAAAAAVIPVIITCVDNPETQASYSPPSRTHHTPHTYYHPPHTPPTLLQPPSHLGCVALLPPRVCGVTRATPEGPHA